MGNEEISNVVKILGLQYSKKYADPSELKSLRYGKLMVMADQDQDGSHIKGLVINFIHHNWPNLLKHSFMEEFITPIVKVCHVAGQLQCRWTERKGEGEIGGSGERGWGRGEQRVKVEGMRFFSS